MREKKRKNELTGFVALISLVLLGFKVSGSSLALNWPWWLVLSPVCVYLFMIYPEIRFSRNMEKRSSGTGLGHNME
jgi:hypothetical protein